MPQSLARVWIHLVFSTKERRAYLQKAPLRQEMFRMLAYHVKNSNCVSGSVGGFCDQVHLLVGLSRTISIADLVQNIKTETSRWAKQAEVGTNSFQWQAGYGAFSVSHSNRHAVDEYIRNQANHHQRMTFQDEYRLLCTKHGIEIDERYVWD